MLQTPSPSITPICPFFYQCGGCDSQDISYSDQLIHKEAVLRELFSEIIAPEIWQPIVSEPSEYPVYYRNKIRFAFVHTPDGIAPSRHQKGNDLADIAVDACFLQSPEADKVMLHTAQAAQKYGWSLYDPKTGSGWLKHILIRQGKHTGDCMISLVTDDQSIPNQKEWLKSVQEELPFVTSIYHSVSWGTSVEKLRDTHLWGEKTITEKVGEYSFAISPQAFFQTNSSMISTLYDGVRRFANLTGKETIWDLYAGSATIGIYLSNYAEKVFAVEKNEANHQDAQTNLELNAIRNVSIIHGGVDDVVNSTFLSENGNPDVIIVDPPRAGLSEKLRRILPNLPKHRLVYVSCNPTTALRDVRELTKRGYKVVAAQPYDMFPHTWHCELITVLERM